MQRDYDPAFLALCAKAKAQIQEVTVEQAYSVLSAVNPPRLIDVREAREWAQEGHLPGAIHLCRGEIEVEIHKHIKDKTTPAILYCGGGNRSALAIVNLQEMGYTRLQSLSGGFKAWLKANYPISHSNLTNA